jgi:hypothetical protein
LIALNHENVSLIQAQIIDGKADLSNPTILYKDQNNNEEGTTYSVVGFIRGAFLGPKELPFQKQN